MYVHSKETMSPRTDEQNETLRAESRARILEHALRLFAEHGYEATSVRMIAQAAGIAQGLLYNYFAGKEQLLHAIFAQSMADVRESFAHAEDSQDSRPQIERLIRASFALVRQHRLFWQLSYSVRMQRAVLAGLGDDLHAWTATIRATLEGYFRAAGAAAPEVEAAILFALIDGVAQHYVLDPENYPLQAVEDALVMKYT
jgi:AcrR family transcriptional regulator